MAGRTNDRELLASARTNKTPVLQAIEVMNKKIQACTGFEPMTSAMPVQRSTNWTNKSTGGW